MPRIIQVCIALIIPVLLIAVTACDPLDVPPREAEEHLFTFDDDMEGWEEQGIDLFNPPVDWHVEHSTEESEVGEGSVELFLFNRNDAAKIWMERSFDMEPNTTYNVQVEYSFATADWGDVNLWTIITGVHQSPPRSQEELTFQENTGNQADEDVGHVWLDKGYAFAQNSGEDGRIYVALGVWGTSEFTRNYFIDNVEVSLQEL